jgi:uncharacterized protein
MENKVFEFIGKALFFPEEKIMVISDLHIGYEESLSEQGIFVPRRQYEEIMKDIKQVFEKIGKVREIIITGDLKHEFGTISSQEWRETREILDFLKTKSEKIVLIKGNHDTILEPIARRGELEIKESYTEGEICFIHGNKMISECLDKRVKMIVMGHRHPAFILSDKYKKERYKCFLVGKWKDKEVIIMPSFFPFIEGTDIVNIEDNSLFIPEKDLKNFEVYAIGDKIYKFGKLKEIV